MSKPRKNQRTKASWKSILCISCVTGAAAVADRVPSRARGASPAARGVSFWKPPLRFALGPLYSLSDTNGFSTWLSVTDMPQNKKAEAEETACRLNGVHSPLLAFFFYRKQGRGGVWGDPKTAYFVCLKMRWALRGAAEVRESQLP